MPHSNSNSEKCSMFVECLLICLFVHCLHLVRSKIEQIQRADRSMDVEWIIINIVYKYFVHTTNLFTRTLHFRFSVSAVDFYFTTLRTNNEVWYVYDTRAGWRVDFYNQKIYAMHMFSFNSFVSIVMKYPFLHFHLACHTFLFDYFCRSRFFLAKWSFLCG